MPNLKRNKIIILLAIVLLAFLLRLYRIGNPILDWHAWRQADTASVTREYVKHGVNLLLPTYHDLSTIPNNLDNSQHGYRMVEFPIINAILALLLRALPQFDLARTSRLLSVWFSLGSLCCLYLLLKKLSGEITALLTAFIFAVLPYSVYYSRVILPEPAMLFFSLLAIYSFYLFLEKFSWPKNNKATWLKLISLPFSQKTSFFYWLISSSSLAIAFLLKPFTVFLAPVFLSLLWQKFQKQKKINAEFKVLVLLSTVLATLSLLPFIIWRQWISQFPEGIPASTWLFNGNGIRLRPAWFRWLFYERFTKLFLGYFGLIFLPFNLFKKTILKNQHDLLVYASWWLGIVAYLVVIATGNVQHDYYQVIAIPIICISFARGLIIAHQMLIKKSSLLIANFICLLIALSSLFFAWQEVKGYFNVNHWEYALAGKVADQLIPANAKIIAPAMGDTMFLFQTNRTGWPIGGGIEEKINQGASHYLSTNNDDEARELQEKYKTVVKNDQFLLLDLTQRLE